MRLRVAGCGLRIGTAVTLAVAACGDGAQVSAIITPADTADQVLLNMSHHLTVEGVRRAHVISDTALFFQGTQSIELLKVHIDFFDIQGRKTSTLTSREGTYWWRTGRMQARGNVIMVRGDGGTLRTEVVNYDQNKDEVSSDLPFTWDAPDRHVRGKGFVSDPNFRDVRAKQPTATGGAFVLPNQ